MISCYYFVAVVNNLSYSKSLKYLLGEKLSKLLSELEEAPPGVEKFFWRVLKNESLGGVIKSLGIKDFEGLLLS